MSQSRIPLIVDDPARPETVELFCHRLPTLFDTAGPADVETVAAESLGSDHERALALNNRAVAEAAVGDLDRAVELLNEAEGLWQDAEFVRHNVRFLRQQSGESGPSTLIRKTRVAIVGLLFNWPSTGGGTVHTKELAEFLSTAGYDVRQFYAVHDAWQIGQVRETLPYSTEPLEFTDDEWTSDAIRDRFRRAVADYEPDYVIVTDSWNTKPLLAEAVSGFPYFIRVAALECLCPLNNVRLLLDGEGLVRQCGRNQLADPSGCRECVSTHGRLSGSLHQLERELGGFSDASYADRLRAAFAGAEGVLAVNPFVAELVKPHAKAVHVIPSGFDARRFPTEVLPRSSAAGDKKRLLFAGLVNEFMKGFRVLQEAGAILWRQRQDFEIWVTADPVGRVNEDMRFVGWQSQESLPGLISDCDILVFPTIAQEALGRTVVEAMGCGRPVVASRIGGLPWVIEEGVTGLLCEPGNAADLAGKVAQLLDDAELRNRLGRTAREKFEREFTWHVVLRQYEGLFGPAERLGTREHRVGTMPAASTSAPGT